MPAPGNARTLTTVVSAYTFAWLAVYVPLETSVTVSIAGPGGLLFSAYIMNLMGMALMLWSAFAARRAQPTAPGLLAAGWAWTAATLWRATSDRFWWVS